MSKKFEVDILQVSSVKKLIKDLKKYKNDFHKKCELLVSRLADSGLQIANAKVSESPLGGYVNLHIESLNIPNGAGTKIVGIGAIKQATGYPDFNILLAVEFGAGIYHNNTPNPYSGQLGFGVGTFPGQTHAFEDSWWYWDEKDQKWKRTYGVKATMPMYSTYMGVKSLVTKTAQEVFK